MEETVAQFDRVSGYYLKRYGQTPRHCFAEKRLWIDIDVTPMPIGAKAEGSERTWMGRNRSKTGRKTSRVTARDYREILHKTLLWSEASAVPALKAALSKLETRLGWTRERRQRIVLRLDGDFGITEVLNGCSTGGIRWSPRSAIVVGSGSCGRPWGRGCKPQAPGVQSPLCCSPPLLSGHVAVGDLHPEGERGLSVCRTRDDLVRPGAGHAGQATIEASFCHDKQALGLVTRRQRRWEAQQMVLLVACLAHHLLLWSKRWLSRIPTTRRRLQGYGLV